jgi:hypothetical protein
MTNDEQTIWQILRSMNQYCYVSPDGFTVYIALPEGLLKLYSGTSLYDKSEEEVNLFIQDALKKQM